MAINGYCLSIVFILLTTTDCETDLSRNNCPDSFNITSANVSTGIGTSPIAVFFYSGFTNEAKVAEVERIFIESDSQAYEQMVTSQYLWPFILAAVLFTITYITVIFCIIFEKSCPPCHSWRRDFTKRPYEKLEIRCVALFSFLFALGILITSIVAFTVVPSMHTELETTKCSMYGALDVALNGDGLQWGGFSHIKNQVGNISQLLPNANSEVNTYFSDDQTIPEMMNRLKQSNLDIYSNNRDAKVSTPNPTSNTPTDSDFIQNHLGPNATAGTMVNDIDVRLRNTQQLSDQANEIINSAFILVESSDTIASNTQASQQALTLYENQLLSFKVNLDKFSQSYFDPIFNWGIYVVEVVLGFTLVASLATLIGTVSVQLLDILECRYFIHFGWVVYGLMYIGVCLTSFFMLPMGSVGYTFCQYYNASLNNQTQYARIGDFYSQNILNKLDVCLFSDGNVLQKFQIAEQMSTVSQLFTNISLFNEYDNASNAKYVDQSLSQAIIQDYLAILEDYRSGKTKDVDVNLSTDDNAIVAISSMNDYTLQTPANLNASERRCTRDRWVYHVDDCLSTDFVYVTTNDQANGLDINMTYDTCFSLNTKLDSNRPGIWSRTQMNKRYRQIRNQCEDVYNRIVPFLQSITSYRDSRINLFQSLIDQLTDLQSQHTNFDTTLGDFRTNLGEFGSKEAIRNLNNYVTNEIDGLLVSSKCKPIANHMRFIYNTFCVNAMGQAVSLGSCALVLMCIMIGGMFTGCVYAQRIATIKRLHTIHDKQDIFALPDQSVHSQKFSRRDRSSSDSSSSEQD